MIKKIVGGVKFCIILIVVDYEKFLGFVNVVVYIMLEVVVEFVEEFDCV